MKKDSKKTVSVRHTPQDFSDLKFRALFENSGTSMVIVDKEGFFHLVNSKAARQFGYDVNEIVGKSLFDLLSDETAQKYLDRNRKLIESGDGEEYEDTFQLSTGQKTFLITDSVLKDRQGIGYALLSSSNDITERKHVENELAQEKTLIDAIINSVPGLIYLYDLEGNLVRWNNKHEIMTGYTAEELSHFKLLDWYKGDIESQIAVNEGLKTTILKGFGSAEARLQKKDGTTIPMYFTASPLTIKDKKYFTGIGIDITERKLAEEAVLKSKQQYDNLVSKIPVGVYILKTKPDGAFALEYASPRMAEMFGLSITDLLTHHEAIFTAIHPEDLDNFTKLNEAGIRHKVPFDWKGRIIVKGEVRWMQISSMPEQLDNGDMLWHGLIVDITERMQDEAEIKFKNEELINLNATKDKFFSIIAHDLKSPFNSIIGLSNILLQQIQEKDYAAIEEYAGFIENSSQQAMDLLMNLLEWSQSQTGKMIFNPENINIVDLINQSTELLNSSARQKSITVLSEMPVNLHVFADKAMINTILRNLISNAIKFTNTGGEIVVSTKQISNELLISVSDNGVGIDKESISKLFRIDKSCSTLGTENEKGTGLGLLLCKEFVERHGGRIWVESESGKGSKFFFSIPNGS